MVSLPELIGATSCQDDISISVSWVFFLQRVLVGTYRTGRVPGAG
jgi:hypothetical protein